MYVLSNFGDQFSERFFPAVHLDHSHSRNDLIHDLYPLICVDSSLVSVNKCRELLLCQRLVTVRIAYTCNFNLIQPIFYFYLKCIFSYYAYNYKNKKGNQFKQSVITINILIDMYQLNWYKLHLKLHLCNPLMSNNPIGLNFVYKYVFHTTLDLIYWRELVVRGGGGFVHLSLANSFPIRLCTGTRQSRTPKPARAEGPSSIHSITKTKMAWVGPIHMQWMNITALIVHKQKIAWS